MLDNKFWDRYFNVYDLLNQLYPYQESLKAVIVVSEADKNSIVLDAGSGTGNLSMGFLKQGVDVVGVELSQKGILKHKSKDKQAKVVLADLSLSLPFVDNSFTHVVMHNVFYALPDKRKPFLLQEIKRVLKNEGKLIMVNPVPKSDAKKIILSHLRTGFKEIGFVKTLFEFCKNIYSFVQLSRCNTVIKNASKGETSFLSTEELKDMLKGNGFLIEAEKYVYANQEILHLAKKREE